MVKIAFDDPMDVAPEDTLSIRLTDNAAKRIGVILNKHGHDKTKTFLRVSVSGGGCSGYNYAFKLDDKMDASDITITNNAVADIRLVIDMMSFNYLKGSTVDFEETLEASQFVINNPNATSSCGCGNSFSL